MDLADYQHEDCGNHNANSGLLRFRSAPSSVLTENSESEQLLSQFVPGNEDSTSLLHFHDFGGKSSAANTKSNSSNGARSSGNVYTLFSSAMNCRSELPPQYPKQSPHGNLSSMRAKNLVRQRSSPAGFLSQFKVQKGYTAARGMDINSSPSSSGVPSPTLGLLSHISEIENEGITENNHEGEKLANSDPRFYGSMFPVDSWNDSAHFVECDGKLFSGIQNRQEGNHPNTLSHHLSLPKPSAENMERLLQFQHSVPCKIRAKRGCATHPRSIAERVRRTRISERMRKLQDLVPSMDKQTNTADMLDLAVDYIKDLQRQFKVLTDVRAKCKCKNS